MEYKEILQYISDGRKELDEAVENIVKLNGDGTLFRVSGPPVKIEKAGIGYVIVNEEEICLAER